MKIGLMKKTVTTIISILYSGMTLFSQIPKHVEYRDTSYIISALNTYHTDLITTVYGGEIKFGVNTNNTINTKLLSIFKKEWT